MSRTDTGTQSDHDTKALLAKAIEALGTKVTLSYVDYRDELSRENCARIVAGDKDAVIEELDSNFEQEYESIGYLLDQCLPDAEERNALRASEQFEEFSQECYERDDSSVYQDLVRHTGRKPIRFYIRNRKGERIAMEQDSWSWDDERVEREAQQLCKAAGLDYDANRDNFRELVVNATYGGVLCIMAYVEMKYVNEWVEHCLRDEERNRVALTFKDPHLLLHDAWNGSGHDVQVTGSVTIRFGRGALNLTHGVMALDAKGVGTGYSWDETAGPYWPAYKCDPDDKLYRVRKGSKPDHPAPESWPGR
jgi:hypothetical protein